MLLKVDNVVEEISRWKISRWTCHIPDEAPSIYQPRKQWTAMMPKKYRYWNGLVESETRCTQVSDSIYPLFGFNVSPRHSRIGSDAKGAAEELDRSYHVGMDSIDFLWFCLTHGRLLWEGKLKPWCWWKVVVASGDRRRTVLSLFLTFCTIVFCSINKSPIKSQTLVYSDAKAQYYVGDDEGLKAWSHEAMRNLHVSADSQHQ